MDTRDKRSSAIAVLSPWRGKLPTPAGAIGQDDRQHVALVYSGILAASAAAGQPYDIRETVHLPSLGPTPGFAR